MTFGTTLSNGIWMPFEPCVYVDSVCRWMSENYYKDDRFNEYI